MTAHAAGPVDGRGLLTIGAIGLVARTHLVIFAPLLPGIRADVSLSYVEAGMATGLSVLAMAFAALLVPRLVARHGTHRAALGGLATIAAGAAVRAIAPTSAVLLGGAVGIGLGLGVVTASIPAAIKEGWPNHPALATGIHAAGFIVGGGAAALAVVPLASWLGGWRAAFLVFAAATAVGAGLWHVTARPRRPHVARAGWVRPPFAPAATAALLFGLQTSIFYGLTAWLPSVHIERGRDPLEAAGLSTIIIVAGLPASLAFAMGADRWGTRSTQLAGSLLITLGGVLGLAWLPDLVPLAAAVAGLGMGGLLTVSMVLPLDLARTPAAVAGITAVMYVVGYVIAAVAPIVLGAIRDATGGFGAVMFAMTIPVLLLVPMVIVVGRVTRRPLPR